MTINQNEVIVKLHIYKPHERAVTENEKMKDREESTVIVKENRPHGVKRRLFLKMGAFSLASAALAGCKKPVEKAIPYLIKPDEITPGVANWYASTCGACSAGCGILVKTREGRPVKLEGNDLDIRTGGGLCAIGQASIWRLYDPERLQRPMVKNTFGEWQEIEWQEIDRNIQQQLSAAAQQGKKVYLLTGTVNSPTIKETVNRFLNAFPNTIHTAYEAVSHSAIAESHRQSHGKPGIPAYRFDNAKLIVSINADFLGTWISPVEFTAQYASGRRLNSGNSGMSRHIQFESRMSLTGSNADLRVPISQSEEAQSLIYLAKLITEKLPPQSLSSAERRFSEITPPADNRLRNHINNVVDELWNARGESLVICGSNDVSIQLTVNYINHRLGSYGKTLGFNRPQDQTHSDDAGVVDMVNSMNNDEVGALIVWGANPAYNYHEEDAFTAGLDRVGVKISLNSWIDETAEHMTHLCPDRHFLEAWGDAEIEDGYFTLSQPTIHPLHNTRQGIETLLKWANTQTSAYDFLKDTWRSEVFTRQSAFTDFQTFWDTALHDGVFSQRDYFPQQVPSEGLSRFTFDFLRLGAAISQLSAQLSSAIPGDSEFELGLYESVALRDGSSAGVPWLQELPDPITKVTWDNVALIAPSAAERLGLKDGSEARIVHNSKTVTMPCLVQPGQHERVISIALGYGRSNAGKAGNNVGVNVYGLVSYKEGAFRYNGETARIEPTGNRILLAKSQTHDSVEGRDFVPEFTLDQFKSGNLPGLQEVRVNPNMWSEHEHKEHRWAMVVDRNACTGCSACVIGCQAENNISTVGKTEVSNRREMHWIRIDRYYEGENQTVHHQPMMCAHCDRAPCETVCPVLATVHSSEGLNMQNYNRCIGTRYCENNCPYKVRRFNWFDYPRDSDLVNLQLNPDVTVRSRGIMEKCTFCVQRIQEKRIKARREGRSVRDGEIQTACQQSCPASAIVFGDLNDSESRISKLIEEKRSYRLLTELNIEPAVWYLAKIRNQT